MKKGIAAICVLVAWLAGASGVWAQLLYSGPTDSNVIWVVNPVDASDLDAISIYLPGEEIRGIRGLAAHPITGQLWALLLLDSSPFRRLVTIDLTTGRATSIGITDSSSSWQGLAFDAAGTLYRIDDNADLVTLNTTDASSTFVTNLTNAQIGRLDAIAFNPLDNMMYHLSGGIGGNGVFEKVDLVTLAVTPIPGFTPGFFTGLTFSPATSDFAFSDRESLFSLTPAGVDNFIGDMIHESGGLAFSNQSLPPLVLPAALYGVLNPFDFDVSVLWAIDPATGVGRRVGPIEDAMSGFDRLTAIDFHPNTNTLYGIGERNTGGAAVLITIDHLTGAATVIGPLVVQRTRDISFRDSDGMLFGNSRDGMITVDTGTGTGTILGNIPGGGGTPRGMSFSPLDELFMAQGDELHKLNPDNVVAGDVEDIFLANFVIPFLETHGLPSMDFQPGTGTLFGLYRQNEDQADMENHLVTVTTNPGVITNVGQTVGDRLDAIAFFPGPAGAIFGDCNGDGKVDAADLVAVLKNRGKSIVACDGDRDGIVETEDIPALLPVILGELR